MVKIKLRQAGVAIRYSKGNPVKTNPCNVPVSLIDRLLFYAFYYYHVRVAIILSSLLLPK